MSSKMLLNFSFCYLWVKPGGRNICLPQFYTNSPESRVFGTANHTFAFRCTVWFSSLHCLLFGWSWSSLSGLFTVHHSSELCAATPAKERSLGQPPAKERSLEQPSVAGAVIGTAICSCRLYYISSLEVGLLRVC